MLARSLVLTLALAPAARAQFQLERYTVNGGGGTVAGGPFTLRVTIGQPEVGAASGGNLTCTAGFWIAATATSCYANCDGSSLAPVLNVNDFQCFINNFAAGVGYANCDGSTSSPVLNVNDFQCFLNAFAAGCS
jgi:hypothetical protein